MPHVRRSNNLSVEAIPGRNNLPHNVISVSDSCSVAFARPHSGLPYAVGLRLRVCLDQ